MSERKQRGTWFIYPVNETRGFAYRELRDDECKQLCLKACEVVPGEITLTREEFREAFAKAYATLENANKQLDATLGLAIERVLFESGESEKAMSQDVTDKSQEFVHCPTCAGLGSIKRWEIEKHESELRRLREEFSEVRQNYYEVVEQRNALVSDNKRLREALEELTNAALADLKPLPSQVEKAFETLKATKE